MTDRRVDRSVASHLAGLEERVRMLETLLGGGRNREIARSFDTLQGTTDSISYGDIIGFISGLPEPGPEVTVTVGRIGIIEVSMSSLIESDSAGGAYANFQLSGANVRVPNDSESLFEEYTPGSGVVGSAHVIRCSRVVLVEGLDPGLTTVKMVYRSQEPGEVSFFDDRELMVIPH